jgi:membrane-bound lytic murein transglycosylase MltF
MKRIVFHATFKKLFLMVVFLFLAPFMETEPVDSDVKLDQKWTGDFDGMAERHLIRALVPYSKTFYFLDGADQRGLTYDSLREFEKYVNKKLKKKAVKVRLLIIPTKRDRLLPALTEGLGDIAAGNLTITEPRKKQVDFAAPHLTGVDEIIVTGPNSPRVKTIHDLAGKEIHVRASSSYYESLLKLNDQFKKEDREPLELVLADEHLEDEDLLEMMNAGIIPIIVIDSHKGKFWAQIFKEMTLHPDIKVRTGGQIGWAIRKNSPGLKAVIDGFVKTHKKGTLVGNILFKRYLEDTKWVQNATSEAELENFNKAIGFFREYADRYDFDWLMIAALAYQESRIDQSKRSPAGAIGVMQLLPSTARDPNVAIEKIEEMEHNIHAGVKYLRFMRDRYFEEEGMNALNKMLFSFASYNAGPARVNKLRREAHKAGLNRNVWFQNVEVIAGKRIGRETVQYVSNIYKYYVAYRFILDKLESKEDIKNEYIEVNKSG